MTAECSAINEVPVSSPPRSKDHQCRENIRAGVRCGVCGVLPSADVMFSKDKEMMQDLVCLWKFLFNRIRLSSPTSRKGSIGN